MGTRGGMKMETLSLINGWEQGLDQWKGKNKINR
jgi:hypothetical protein